MFCRGKSRLGNELRRQLGTKDKFLDFINSLCLTDRQKKIAEFKLLRGWRNIDIAVEIDISERTVVEEIKQIQAVIGTTNILNGE